MDRQTLYAQFGSLSSTTTMVHMSVYLHIIEPYAVVVVGNLESFSYYTKEKG
jgi:hypothetical protein